MSTEAGEIGILGQLALTPAGMEQSLGPASAIIHLPRDLETHVQMMGRKHKTAMR